MKKAFEALDLYLQASYLVKIKEDELNKGKQEISSIARKVAQHHNPEDASLQELAAEDLLVLAQEHQAANIDAAVCKTEYGVLIQASSHILHKAEGKRILSQDFICFLTQRVKSHLESLLRRISGTETMKRKDGEDVELDIVECVMLLAEENQDESKKAASGGSKENLGKKGKKKSRKTARKAERRRCRQTRRASHENTFLDEETFYESLQQKTLGTGGIDVLASSDKIQLSLAVGKNMRPGFSILGKGDYSVGTQEVPREKWVGYSGMIHHIMSSISLRYNSDVPTLSSLLPFADSCCVCCK